MGATMKPRARTMTLWPGAQRQRHADLQRALERLEDLREQLITKLDALEGDPDLEPALGANGLMDQTRWADGSPALMAYADLEEQCEGGGGDDACEDEAGACEDEGADTDREPDHEHEACHWQDEGDQTCLKPHPVYLRSRHARPSWANLVGEQVTVGGANGIVRVPVRL